MTGEPLLYDDDSGIITLTLNRPEKLNAINPELEEELELRLKELGQSERARVIIIRGAGRAFCAGADLGGDAERGTNEVHGWREAFLRSHRVYMSMLNSPKPIIAATHGYVIGMGFYLATAADMIISTDDCKFGVSEIRHAQSSTAWLPVWNVRRNQLMELLLTGDLIDGRRAEAIGLVNKAIPAELFESGIHRLARKLSLLDRLSISMNKAAINVWYDVEKYVMASLYSVENNAALNVSEPHKVWDEIFKSEGLKGFLRRRDGPFRKLDEE